MTTVLVVEDDQGLSRALAITLRSQRYEVLVAATGTAAIEAAARRHPDLVVLDLGLPDLDGMDVLRAMRGWSTVPVVVLSARGGPSDKVAALDAGADDYVTKPFGMDELLARLRAAARRLQPQRDEPVVVTATFTVDLPHRRVTRDGVEVRLTPTEWRILEILARDAGRIVAGRELFRQLRGPNVPPEPHYLRVFLAQLRAKLEVDPAQPRHLITEPGVGYRLVP
jgi:two-component system KDP operon response regulator KdpE